MDIAIGQKVIIHDFSEAHGQRGIITHIQERGFIYVTLKDYIWPVTADELRPDTAEEEEDNADGV